MFGVSKKYLGKQALNRAQLPLIAQMYLENGMTDSAVYITDYMESVDSSSRSNSWHRHVKSMIYDKEGNYKMALVELNASDSISNERLNRILKTNVSGVADMYHSNLLEHERESLYKTRLWLYASFTIALLIVAFTILYHIKSLRLRKAQTGELLSSLSDVPARNGDGTGIPESARSYMETLYEYHIRYLQARNSHDRNELESVLSEFDRLVKESDTDRFIRSIIDNLNKSQDNVIEKLTSQIPDMNPRYVKVYALLRSGIPVQFCAILMKTSQDNMHTLKFRIYKKIRESECQDKDFFLDTNQK